MAGDQAFSPAEVARSPSLIAQDLSTGDSIACDRENTDLIYVLNLSVLVYISRQYIPRSDSKYRRNVSYITSQEVRVLCKSTAVGSEKINPTRNNK